RWRAPAKAAARWRRGSPRKRVPRRADASANPPTAASSVAPAGARLKGSPALLRPRVCVFVDLQEALAGNVRVPLRGRQCSVAEQLLDPAQVGAHVEQMGGER